MFSNMTLRFVLVVGLAAIFRSVQGTGQLCYSCVAQGGDDTCLKNPAAVVGGVVKCKYDYCTIRRQENPQGSRVNSFYRGCEGKDNALPDGPNYDPAGTIWAWSCRTDLCNTGDGLKPPGGPGTGGEGAGGGPYLVPGSSGSVFHVDCFVFVLALVLLTLRFL